LRFSERRNQLRVRLISQETESNDSIHSSSHALIGGVQPNMVGGPLWQRYINRGGAGARSTRFTAIAIDPPTHPTDLGLALGHRKHHHRRHPHSPTLTTVAILMASSSGSSSQGAGDTPLPLRSLSHTQSITNYAQRSIYRVVLA
jgi:hypothetical protein